MPKKTFNRARGFRSGLESKVQEQLEAEGVEHEYEKTKVSYSIPESQHKYTPDFFLTKTGIYVEVKGLFELADRKKHLLIKEQHPDLDIRFLFQRSASPIRKGSKTTYADWCNANGFIYADKVIPQEWLH